MDTDKLDKLLSLVWFKQFTKEFLNIERAAKFMVTAKPIMARNGGEKEFGVTKMRFMNQCEELLETIKVIVAEEKERSAKGESRNAEEEALKLLRNEPSIFDAPFLGSETDKGHA